MGWGKIAGFLLGWMLTRSFFGALLGLVIGHFLFDHKAGGFPGGMGFGADAAEVRRVFFETTFSVMGHVAKADGRVTEIEIRMARAVMNHLRLSPERTEAAMHLFNDGKRTDFPLDDAMQRFVRACRHRRDLHRIFIEIQLQAALADGQITDAERRVLERVASHLGVPAWELRQLEALILAAQRRHQAGAGGTAGPARPSLDDAYAMLGVTRDASDSEVKKAYRRLMSQHHPDKLAANGLPDDMREVAAEKTREIRAAYEQVRDARGMK
ncbi:MAG TPA: co-chaperone DjlA [Gammaproteobacteria bacterium]